MATNPYLETLQQAPTATGAMPENPYLSLLRDADSMRKTRMAAAVQQAVEVNPEQYSAQRRVAQYLGYPVAAVEALPELQQQAKARQVQQAAGAAPALQRAFADADFAKLAHDDADTLARLAGGFRSGAKWVFSHPDAENTLVGTLGASAFALNEGAAGALQAAGELPAPLLDFLEAATPEEAAGWRGAIGGNPLRRLAEGAQRIAAQSKADAERLDPQLPGLAGGVQSGVRSFGQQVPGMVAAMLTGNPNFAMTVLTTAAGGQAYRQAREQGMDERQALVFATSQAAIEYATEKLPLERLIGDVKAAAPLWQTLARQAALEVPGEQIATALQDMNEWAVLPENQGKPFSAYLQERPNAALQTLVATLVGTGGNVVLTRAVDGVLREADGRALESHAAQTDAQALEQLLALAGESRLRERAPDKLAALVQEMAADTEGAPVEVRFDARTLADTLQQAGVDDVQLSALMPSLTAQLREALAIGGEVTVPVGEFVALAGSGLEQTLMQHARIGDNELSIAEAKEADAQTQELLQQQGQQLVQLAAEVATTRASAEQVKQQVLDQLNAAKRFTADVNDAYATLVRDFYAATAHRLGTTPEALFQQYPLRVQAQGAQGEKLNQTPEFAAWFRDSKVVDAEGKPLVVYHGTASADIVEFLPRSQSGGANTKRSQELVDWFRAQQSKNARIGYMTFRSGSFFSPDPNYAGNYTGEDGGVMYPVYIRAENPIYFDQRTKEVSGVDPTKTPDALIMHVGGKINEVAVLDPAQVKSAIGNDGSFDANDPSILSQGPRGTYSPSTLTISLLKKADLSTFLHETGHFFLETLADLASRPNAPSDVLADMNAVLAWFGIKGTEQAGGQDAGGQLNQSAYHGTPHRGIEKFSTDKIGTGEGAQAYGWGLYFASKREIAEHYRKTLTNRDEADLWTPELRAQLAPHLTRVEQQELNDLSNDMWKKGNLPASQMVEWRRLKDKENAYKESVERLRPKGQLYEVEIPEDSEMLLWDRPLSEQPERVREALDDKAEAFFVEQADMAGMDLDAYERMLIDTRAKYPPQTRNGVDGETYYRELAAYFGNQKQASEYLASAGIKGIKYLDGTSRADGDGSYNYVIFSGDDVQITEQFYQGGPTPDAPEPAPQRTPLDTWRAMTLEQKRKFHERFAESFEQYLLEGKAPSTELQPLFQRFRAWLVNVYRSLTEFLKGRDLQLSDEVRGVFDRLLATREQIAQAEAARGMQPLFKSADEAGMTPEQWAAYQAQGQAASEQAMDRLQARSMRDMRWTTGARSRALKALQQEAADKRKAVEAEVRAEVSQQPVYRAMHWLRKGEMTTDAGEEIKAEKGFRLNTAALAEMYPESALNRPDLDRLKGMTAGNGLHPDIVAGMFGYASGDELVRALVEAEPMASVVEGMTDQRMLERFGDLATEQGIQRAADEAVHNEARGRFVATELKALRESMGATERTPRGGSVNVMVRAAKQAAEQLVAARKVRELKPGQHTAAEGRAARTADRALRKGDTQAAIVAKRDQLLHHYAARATNEAVDQIERGVEYLKKFSRDSVRKKLPAEYLDQIDKLLERVDLRQTSNKALDKRAKLAAWVEEQRAIGIEPDIPDYLLEDAQLVSHRDMTVEQMRGLLDTVRQIEHLARLKNKLLTAKDQREFDAIRDSIVQSILGNAGKRSANTRTPTTNLGRAAAMAKMFGASHVKVATWARIMDGGKDGGPVWEYFVRSANERGDMETTMRAKATEDLAKLMAPLFERGKLGGSGTFFQSIGRSLNRESVLAIALNTGNESNLQRLLGGEGWTVDQIQPVLATLTAQDWAVVQGVWDYFETYRPLIAEKERRVFGKEPAWIEAGSAVTQLFGVKGGYYPVKYDPAASQRAEEHADAEGAKRQLQGAYGATTTRRSFTKGRVEEVVGRPLLYTLQGVYSGVNDVIHDLAWHEWLIDVNRLLRSKSIDTAMREKYGPEVVRQFKGWRDDIAEGDSAPQRALDTALGKLRQSVSVAGLGFNVMSALMQPLGLAQSVQRVGAAWVSRGVMRAIGGPRQLSVEVNEKSAFMRNRARTRFRELNELRNRVQGQTAVKRVVQDHAYALMMAAQRMVDLPTWWGAYEKALASGEAEARAVALADQAVIDSQGGGETKDLAAIERGPQALKLFTVFYSFMNTALNLGVASKMTPRSKARFAADMLLLYVVPAVLGSALKDALTPGEPPEEELARKLASEQLSYLLGLVVLAREMGSMAETLTGSPGARDYTGPAGLRAINDAMLFGKQAAQGEFDDAFRKAAVNLAGDLLGLPSAQINRTITGAKALADDRTDNPAALLLGFQGQ